MSTLELGEGGTIKIGSGEAIELPEKSPSEELVAVDTPVVSESSIELPKAGTILVEDALIIESTSPINLPDKEVEPGVVLLETIQVDGCSISDGSSPPPVTSCCVYTNADPVSVTVGGIEKGDTFFLGGKDFLQTMAAMFYPVIYPTFVNPSSSFSFSASSLYEVNATIAIDFTAQFNRGSINLDGSFQNYRAGLPNTYNYTGTGLSPTVSSTSLTDTHSISYTVETGYNTWSSNIDYDEGPQPLDSEGNPYDSPLPAGTTNTISRTLEGVYPLFANSTDITYMSKQPLVSMITGNNVQIDFPPETGKKQVFDIPEEWEVSRPLVTVETYNTLSGNWEDTGLSEWTTGSSSHDIQGITIDYNRYTYNGPDRGAITIRLKF